MKKAVAIFVSLVILLCGIYVYGEITASDTTVKQSSHKTKYEIGPPDPQEMLELVNVERKKVGVPPLSIDDNVQKSAQLKAEDMDKRNYFQHNVLGTEYTLTPEMAYWVNKSCKSSGENITDNGTDEDNTSWRANFSFLTSKPHYEAMINPKYTKIGFGVSGTKVVQHFCVPL